MGDPEILRRALAEKLIVVETAHRGRSTFTGTCLLDAGACRWRTNPRGSSDTAFRDLADHQVAEHVDEIVQLYRAEQVREVAL